MPTVPTDTDTVPTDPNAPRFAEDVRPLIAANCQRCHGVSALAPMDFTDYDTASAWAEVMLARIDAGEMPPPAADPDCHPYQGSDEYTLDPELRPTLAAWIDGGKPAGDLAGTPLPPPWEAATLPRHDLELRPPAAIAPQFVDGNEYRCFVLDTVEQNTYITGIEFLMDHPQISHHALLFVDPDGGSERDVTDTASMSYPCPSVQPEFNWQSVHAWAPGGEAIAFPEGKGIRLERGSQLVLQMHYFAGTTDTLEDLPGYALMLANQVDQELLYAPIGPDDFTIPAGDPSYTNTLEVSMFWLTFGASADVYGVMPHMHVLGTAYDFHARTASGDETCISRMGSGYDFALQPTYWFDEPVHVNGNDTLSISCTWDNSAENPRQLSDPPAAVGWGENTQQEMCYALMYIALN